MINSPATTALNQIMNTENKNSIQRNNNRHSLSLKQPTTTTTTQQQQQQQHRYLTTTPVAGPSARPDWAHTSTSSSTTTNSSNHHRPPARSYTLVPPESLSSPNNHRFIPPPQNLRVSPTLAASRNTIDNRPPNHPPPPNPSVGQDRPSNPPPAANQLEAKVVILGMQGVGKTSIVHRYTTGSFSYSLTSTIGASFCTKKLSVDGCKVRLQIWDTAGQERFRSMAPMYYRGANAAILVYDITNKESFLDIQNWLDELRQNMSADLIIQVVGSKADLATERRAVDLDEAQSRLAAWTAGAVRPEDGQLVLSPSGPAITTTSATASTGAEGAGASSSTGTGGNWTHVGISEVSAKDDFGIEELFLILSRRLVLRKSQIDALRIQRSRDSIRVSTSTSYPHHLVDHSSAAHHLDPLVSNSSNSNSFSSGSGFCC